MRRIYLLTAWLFICLNCLGQEKFFETNVKPLLTDYPDCKKIESIIAAHKESNGELLWGLGFLDTYANLLSKPENFDPAKKYPVIISISGNQNKDIVFNKTYFTSRGFVIMEIPAIINTGAPGPFMVQQVRHAIDRMKEHSWFDTARLGIHGSGMNGYFVNYIIAQLPVFSAANQCGGVADLISHYGSVNAKGESNHSIYDSPSGFFGKTLWEDSALYINQSPITLVNRIATPLLIMHSKLDTLIPFEQSIELFTALRRLGKPCWLLEYEEPNGLDFTARLEQFYNHYLKGTEAPVWMTRRFKER